MAMVNQGFYGTVERQGNWAIKVCTSPAQCQDELVAWRRLMGKANIAKGIEAIDAVSYRYLWCEGQTLACQPQGVQQAWRVLAQLHRHTAAVYHWAGMVAHQWWQCFQRWVFSWFWQARKHLPHRLYQQLLALVAHIPRYLSLIPNAPTLVHGDPHPENIIVGADQACLIDPGIVGYAVPQLDWAMYWRPGFDLPDSMQPYRRSILLMRILMDAWHLQRTAWRDDAYFEQLLTQYYSAATTSVGCIQ